MTIINIPMFDGYKADSDGFIIGPKNHVFSSKFIYDHFQLAGLKDITIKVIGYGNKALETEVLLRYSHHNIKLEYI